jgi:diaminohydroxyphosphoribosylaminopyrimidine deaminase/5-amino-6-(5-phosphoribosylamino)uracil reductase
MQWLPGDSGFLQRAIELARTASGLASPNPTVGCVIARTDAQGEPLGISGEGAHRYDNFDHAEIAALNDAARRGHDVRGATAYVTLEPCTTHGRTGPCADALIAAGIARCVIATVDPNPAVEGRGVERMRAAGIDVVVAEPQSDLAREARRLNDGFAFSVRKRRPFVTLKAAISVDGKLAPPAQDRIPGEPFWLTGDAARADVQRLRHAADALVTGIGTVLADDPASTDRSGLPRRKPLLRVVLDSDLRLPLDSRMVRSAKDDLLVLCAGPAPAKRETELREAGARVVRVARGADDRLSLKTVMETLDACGVRSLLVEAGAAVNGSFLSAGLVDQLVLYVAEVELGADALPFAAGPSPYVLQSQMFGMARTAFARDDGRGDDVRLSGYLHDPWAGVGA